MPPFQLSLKGRALRYLAAREHSRSELERKLAEHEAEPGELARVLDELTAKGFISEARVVESVLHRRASKLGTDRVVHELRGKGVSAEALAEAAQRLRESEFERACEVWRRKFAASAAEPDEPTEPTERMRQMRFLAARGFSAEVVRRVVREMISPQ
ncbi:recombination regulator RecX [Ottowia thiooxydans]|uniref:recombination regulator RecX n=1 Tax=Ottowia thiooxydans TaxID=219182 RepID=UPI0003FB0F78|nr:recombination regulator RecX [Ottowia thiooxydans]